MKKQFVVAILLLGGAAQVASADNTTIGSEIVPSNHWAYECKEKLCSLMETPRIYLKKSGPWTRMDFGMLCARFSDFRTDLSDPTAKDILYTLNREFAKEREKYGAPDIFADKTNGPPRIYILPSIGRGMRSDYYGQNGRMLFSAKFQFNLKH